MQLVFLGPPGAGKGTQAIGVAEAQAVPHISTGDILRAAVAAGTELGLEAKRYMDGGKLVPDEVIAGVVSVRLREADCAPGFVLDGFPRTLPQAEILAGKLEEMGRGLDHVVLLEVPTPELERRLLARGGGRSDDNPEVIRSRLEVYENETRPRVGFYEERNLLRHIDGVGDVEQIRSRIGEALGLGR